MILMEEVVSFVMVYSFNKFHKTELFGSGVMGNSKLVFSLWFLVFGFVISISSLIYATFGMNTPVE